MGGSEMAVENIDRNDLQKRYACSYCGKPFSRSEHKVRHERSHTGVKPFECKVCQHAFVRRDLLQRHIRTVHREVLLLRKSAKKAEELAAGSAANSSAGKSDMLLELLVNSMIKVSEEGSAAVERKGMAGGSVQGRKHTWKGGRSGAENGLSRREARAVSACINRAVGIDRIRSLYGVGMEHVTERHVLTWAVQSHVRGDVCLAAAVVCLGVHVSNPDDKAGDEMWQACWGKSLEQGSVTAVNLLTHVLLTFGGQRDASTTDVGQVFTQYQGFFVDRLADLEGTFDDNEIWFVFHIWVSLLRVSHEPTSLSIRVYDWFLQRRFVKERALKDVVYQVVMGSSRWPLATLDLVADALFSDWIISERQLESNDPLGVSLQFKTGAEFHNAMVVVLKKFAAETGTREELVKGLNIVEHPAKFTYPLSQHLITIQSDSHWLLLETAWFSLIQRLNAKQDNKYWFMDSMAEFPTIFVESSMIDDTFATCCIPILALLSLGDEVNARYVSLISDVVVFLIRLFEFEMSINSNKYCPNRLVAMLKNPVIQLLLFIGYRVSGSAGHSQQDSIAVDHFMNRYVVNCNWLVNKQMEEELTHNLFDSQSLGYIGFHQLIQDFVSYLRNSIISERLMKVPHLNHDIKLRLFDFAQQHCHNLHHPTQDLQAARRLTEPWHSPQSGPLWMFSPQSRSMSIDSSTPDHPSVFSAGMSQSNSLDSSILRDPNVILPPLNETLLVRQQPKPPYYKYGTVSCETPHSNHRLSNAAPILTSPNFGNIDGVFLDKGDSSCTSPRSNGQPAMGRLPVRLPPPSELFG